MTQIQSDMTEAQTFATGLTNPSQGLAAVALSDKDSQTTVAGNGKAHELIDIAHGTGQTIAEVLIGAVANIKTVASEFEAIDQDTAAAIEEGK